MSIEQAARDDTTARFPVPFEPKVGALFDRMVRFVEDAGRLALDARSAGLRVSHKEDDLAQALTDADEAISGTMNAAFGPRLIEEETAARWTIADCRALLAEESWAFIGDPIDGTKPFAGGLSGWGTMLAGCRRGWPEVGVIGLPAWIDHRDRIGETVPAAQQRGMIFAAAAGQALWAPTLHGRAVGAFKPLLRPATKTHHVGWLPIVAKSYTLDYAQGLFPWGESSVVSDAALLATGRLDATFFNAKLWDLAGMWPILEALGFQLFLWPSLAMPVRDIIGLFADDYSSADRLLIIARDVEVAQRMAAAVQRRT